MKRKWRYDRQLPICNLQLANDGRQFNYCLLPVIYFLVVLASCHNGNESNQIPTTSASDLNALVLPTNQTVFSEIKTIRPTQQSVSLDIYATGVITYDPRFINTISSRFGGRIEKLYVRFNFENVAEGQRIMDIYSPDILTAEKNLVFLLSNSSIDTALINLATQKLQLLGLTNEQLKQIERTKQVINPLPVFSPYSGHIHDIGVTGGTASSPNMNTGMNGGVNSSSASSAAQIENLPFSRTSALSIKEGMYVETGQSIFEVYNINRVWAVLNIFPRDAALIKAGDNVSITAETSPSNVISSTISYIEPFSGQNASAIKARVYLQNADKLHLKIGTLLSATISAAEIEGIWLPRNAVINLGQKQIVFLKTDKYFVSKIVQTGITTDSLIQITRGLQGNEKIAINAQFMVDSESFIQTTNDK